MCYCTNGNYIKERKSVRDFFQNVGRSVIPKFRLILGGFNEKQHKTKITKILPLHLFITTSTQTLIKKETTKQQQRTHNRTQLNSQLP